MKNSFLIVIIICLSCNQFETSHTEMAFCQDTLVSNSNEIYHVIGDTISLNGSYKGEKGLILRLYKNEELILKDTVLPNSFSFINSWDTFSQNGFKNSQLNIKYKGKKYNLFVLNENKMVIDYQFKSLFYSKDSKGKWHPFELELYPQYISQLNEIAVNADSGVVSITGVNYDLAGNSYKGDSLVIGYKRDSFEILNFFPKSKLPNVIYYEN